MFIFSLLALFLPQISAAEILTATDKVVERFMELDLDESESVSFEEYQTMVLRRLDKRFSQMDKNADGEVSDEEYRNFWTTTKSKYYRPQR